MDETLESGRYRIRVVTSDARDVEFDPCDGEIELLADGSVTGQITDGPIVEGRWQGEEVNFVLLYNATIPYRYIFNPISQAPGTWRLDIGGSRADHKASGPLPDEHGTFELLDWMCIETSAQRAQKDMAELEGNTACHVKHVSSVPVPCAVCGCDDGTSRLAFFEMTIPNFGTAELSSFSCGGCHYKTSKLRTTERPKGFGVIIRMVVDRASLLDKTVVLTDSAVVKCPELDTQISNGTGRYTTVEGILRGCATVLKTTSMAMDDAEGGSVDAFLTRIDELIAGVRDGSQTFKVEIDDPVGLSFIDGADVVTYERSAEQDEELGLTQAMAMLSTDANGVSVDDAERPSQIPLHLAGGAVAVRPISKAASDETKNLMKACEAVAAEFTKVYEPANEDGNENGDVDVDGANDGANEEIDRGSNGDAGDGDIDSKRGTDREAGDGPDVQSESEDEAEQVSEMDGCD